MWMLVWTLLSASSPTSEDAKLWAGHHVAEGQREVPFLGTLETRMDTWVLARVRHDSSGIVLREQACAIRFAEVAGVRVVMPAAAIPITEVLFEHTGAGRYSARSSHGWGREDVDGDGHPGMTIHVDAPLCEGSLYVANRSSSRAQARTVGGALRGHASVWVEQRELGASRACLRWGPDVTEERLRERFAYVPVPEGSDCSSLQSEGWPVTATP